jgi:ABC-type transporter Mla subunit MlaD
MADLFAVDAAVARRLSGDLTSIRTSLSTLGADLSGMHGQTGSGDVEGALDRFVHDSSDSRGNLDKLLERAIGLLDALADGTQAVDTALAQSFDPAAAPPGPGAPPGPSGPTAPPGAALAAQMAAP